MSLIVLGGYTGSGKTAILQHLYRLNCQVLNLEKLCGHAGSAFGHLLYTQSATSYEAHKLLQKTWRTFDFTKPVFTEGKPPTIGSIQLPGWLLQQVQQAPVIWLDVPKALRVHRLLQQYGHMDVLHFTHALISLSDKLSNQQMEEIAVCYADGEKERAFSLLVDYYDKGQYYQQKESCIIEKIAVQQWDIDTISNRVLAAAEQYWQLKTVSEQKHPIEDFM